MSERYHIFCFANIGRLFFTPCFDSFFFFKCGLLKQRLFHCLCDVFQLIPIRAAGQWIRYAWISCLHFTPPILSVNVSRALYFFNNIKNCVKTEAMLAAARALATVNGQHFVFDDKDDDVLPLLSPFPKTKFFSLKTLEMRICIFFHTLCL